MKVLALTRYGALGASSRVRMMQYRDALAAHDISLEVSPLLGDDYVRRLYDGRVRWTAIASGYARRMATMASLARHAQVLWIEKELWPWAPAWFERLVERGRPVVLDFDDAIFHNYDLHRLPIVRRVWGTKIDRIMQASRIVLAGNDYLATRARQAGARDVRILPTVVDLSRYPDAESRILGPGEPVRIAWIGSPSTVGYLQGLAATLARVSARCPIELHVIGARIDLPGVRVVPVAWSEEREAQAIADCDVGIMPLPDSPWERGKCGYKLIQYMACARPVVASPVGVNADIVREGVNGFLADGEDAWAAALLRLCADAGLRARLGAAGRACVVDRFSVQASAPALAAALHAAAGPLSPLTEH